MLDLLDLAGAVPVIAGSELPLTGRRAEPSAAAEAIVAEAMRTDTELPLYVVLGAGLTELASAYLIEPAIADRLTAVWIGGPEYTELGAVAPPAPMPIEYNLNIDLLAGQVVFDSPIPLWQVPRNAYRECIASMSELILRVRSRGAIGRTSTRRWWNPRHGRAARPEHGGDVRPRRQPAGPAHRAADRVRGRPRIELVRSRAPAADRRRRRLRRESEAANRCGCSPAWMSG